VSVRHALSLEEIGPQNLSRMINDSLEIAAGDAGRTKPLAGKIAGIFFRGTSTRTRTAFTVGALKLGASIITYGPDDLQIKTGETIEDTARVLSRYLDILVIRTNDSIAEMQALAAQDEMAVINAMSENEHPTQAIADLVTIKENFGHLHVHVLYLGEGNNSAAALALAVSMTPGMRLTLVTPEGYGVPAHVLETASRLALQHGASIEQHHRIDDLPKGVDVVYTTRWQTMGVPKGDPNWLEKFKPYSVTQALMVQTSKPSGKTIFLHDLPAIRGMEVHDEVLDGPQSRAFRQSEHKLNSAMAVLQWCLAKNNR
jgi:ornithine carbamoyltransferase